LVYIEKHPYILNELLKIGKNLKSPFPYRVTEKIQDDFSNHFSEDDCLNGDLNTYWMNIVASSNYIVRGKSRGISKESIEWLKTSFFDIFKQYKFLEVHIDKYPIFYKEYINHEKARMLILYYLFLENNH
jgi:hypothetical protein